MTTMARQEHEIEYLSELCDALGVDPTVSNSIWRACQPNARVDHPIPILKRSFSTWLTVLVNFYLHPWLLERDQWTEEFLQSAGYRMAEGVKGSVNDLIGEQARLKSLVRLLSSTGLEAHARFFLLNIDTGMLKAVSESLDRAKAEVAAIREIIDQRGLPAIIHMLESENEQDEANA